MFSIPSSRPDIVFVPSLSWQTIALVLYGHKKKKRAVGDETKTKTKTKKKTKTEERVFFSFSFFFLFALPLFFFFSFFFLPLWSRVRRTVRLAPNAKNATLFSQLSLCLSRACHGKLFVFIYTYKWHRKKWRCFSHQIIEEDQVGHKVQQRFAQGLVGHKRNIPRLQREREREINIYIYQQQKDIVIIM